MSHECGTSVDVDVPTWRASSYSGGQGDCVEVDDHIPGVVPVRDSKRPGGPVLAFSRTAWAVFVSRLV
ncbi:DUF397 domain-containing protein [Streptomyces sp. TS71-3]|uniref:DUF397 domain-containing protein n=1 Tax=Streptomyces sp. TS71-3 TaxID=2733862 RepID=UPI001B2E5583|nr:DUF397 domain-containing protein [Streptomyces sp. TS71-3]GHJ34928.1 hypothetical protein Sm713_05370 [Streptomyces sp. TS71-3]